MGILVETIATLISMSSRIATSRVSKPIIRNAPHTISTPPTNGPIMSGAGMPILAKRPAPRSRGGGACSDFGSELRQVVNAELLYDTGHFIDHSYKTIFTEKFVLLFLEIFSERTVFILAHDLAELGKENRVLTRLMWVVHADELPQGIGKFTPVIRILESLVGRELHRDVGHFPSTLM